MKISKSELIAILSQLNPWWKGERAVPNLPLWRRAVFHQLFAWVANPPAPRAVLLSGARQVGKTTLLLQSIEELLKRGMPPGNILYATFDHPIIKLAGMDAVLEAWQERVSQSKGTEYLFLDEAQFIQDWGAWVKHQVDFNKNRRITFTGSAMPLIRENQESGVGRWHTIRLTTLSFYEYIQLESYKEIKFFKDFFEQAYGGSQFGFRNIELKDDLLTGKLFKNLFQNVDLETLKNKLKNTAQLKEYDQPKLPELKSLRDLFN
ncbi:AAA family ATPase, partial [Coxiella burnetii]